MKDELHCGDSGSVVFNRVHKGILCIHIKDVNQPVLPCSGKQLQPRKRIREVNGGDVLVVGLDQHNLCSMLHDIQHYHREGHQSNLFEKVHFENAHIAVRVTTGQLEAIMVELHAAQPSLPATLALHSVDALEPIKRKGLLGLDDSLEAGMCRRVLCTVHQ